MANIGTFTAQNDGFNGTLRTLTLNAKLKLVPNEKTSEHAPDYRIQAVSGNEIGAAWRKTSQASRQYLSVIIDDPAFAAPIYARLMQADDGAYTLLWSRTKGE